MVGFDGAFYLVLCNWFTTDVFSQAINLQAIAQVMTLIGSGFMGRTICDFFGDPGAAAWPSSIISICIVSLSVPLAHAVDFWGRKWILVGFSASGFVGLLIISRANSIGAAITGFCFSGLAFGPSFAVYAIVSEILPRKNRAMAQAAIQMATGLGAIVAILVAGALLRHNDVLNFRVYYYISAAIYGVSTILLVVAYRPPPRQLQVTLTFWQKLQSMDWAGILLLTTGSCLFDVSLISIGNPHPFVSAQNLTLFVLGIVILMVFVLHGIFIKTDGLLHHKLFRNRNFVIVLFVIFTEGLMFFTINSYLIVEQLVLKRENAWDASLRYLMVFLFILIFAFLTGLYTTYTKRIADPLILGFAVMLVFAALMTTVTHVTTVSKMYGLAVLAGIGDGAIFVNLAVAAQMATPRDMIALTTGLFIAARGLGGVVIIPVNTAVFGHTLSQHLVPDIASAVLPLGLPAKQLGKLVEALVAGNATLIETVPGATRPIIGAATDGLLEAYATSYRMVWFVTLAFIAVSLIGTSSMTC